MQLNHFLMGELLKTYGLVPVFARNGQEAFQLATKESFVLIFLDVYMPVMDGIECARLLRSLSNANANVPLVAVTAHQFESELAEFKKAGFTATLVKPVSQDQLDQLLVTLLATAPTTHPSVYTHETVIENSELVIDLSYLKEVGKNNSVFIIKMLDSFCQTSESILSNLEEAILKKEDASIKDLLHQLKFPLGVIGQSALVSQIATLELVIQDQLNDIPNENHYEKIKELIPLLKNLIVQARTLIPKVDL